MSLQAKPFPPLPVETARLAQKVFKRKGNIYLTIGDQIGTLFEDVDFGALYGADGAPAYSPNLLALAVIFQRMEDLGDQALADAIRARIDLKYALHLELDDTGFDGSLLSDFRRRLLQQDAAQRLFEGVLQRLASLGLVRGGGKQRTDGSYVLGATRLLNQVELLGETLRVALEAVAAYRPDWLRDVALPHWQASYGAVFTTWRLPKSQEKRQQLALAIAADGYHLLAALAEPEAPSQAGQLPAVVTLRQVWEQRVTRQGDSITLRPRDELPPGAELISTPHDPEVRGSVHGEHAWEGYGLHWTETCDADHPHLITDVGVVPATTADVTQLPAIHERLAQRNLLPAEHAIDAGYTAGHVLVASLARGIRLIGPFKGESTWQAHTPGGLTSDQFQMDWVRQVATCPQGQHAKSWSLHANAAGQPVVDIKFTPEVCAACPVRALCTRGAQGRTLQLSIYHDVILAARQSQQTPEFKQAYAIRAGIEATVSETVRAHGARRARYIGLLKTHVQALLTATAVNLKRAALWLMAKPLAQTRPPGLSCLAPQLAP
jgi:transposase